MEKVKCDLCENNNTDFFCKLRSIDFKGELFTLEKCRRCGLFFINPRPTEEEIKKYYPDKDYYAYSQAEKEFQVQDKNKFRKLINSIRRATIIEYYAGKRDYPVFLKLKNRILAFFGRHRFGSAPQGLKVGTILDVGCGDGRFLSHLKDLGWEVTGVEVNSYAAEKARKRGLDVYDKDLLDIDFGGKTFDVVRIWSVLEHLHQPSLTLKKINQILKKDGFLITQTPNFNSLARKFFKENWAAFDTPRHLYSFNQKTLKRITEKNNFEVLKILTISVGTIEASFKHHHSVLKPFLFAFDIFLDALNLGDCLVCYAKKKEKKLCI